MIGLILPNHMPVPLAWGLITGSEGENEVNWFITLGMQYRAAIVDWFKEQPRGNLNLGIGMCCFHVISAVRFASDSIDNIMMTLMIPIFGWIRVPCGLFGYVLLAEYRSGPFYTIGSGCW